MSQQKCPTCGGRGAVANALTGSAETCPTCQGSGNVSLGLTDLPFWYMLLAPGTNLPPVLTADQANVACSVAIENDADFVCDRIVASSTGLFSIFLTDGFTSKTFSPSQDVPINGENIAGTAQLPFWLPRPYLFRRTSSIKALLTDRSGAGNTIQFAFVGHKVS